MSGGTSWRTAPPGSVCCYLCKRYFAPEKLEDNRCINERGCSLAAARTVVPVFRTKRQLLGLPPKRKRAA